jgi:hypothetical protein
MIHQQLTLKCKTFQMKHSLLFFLFLISSTLALFAQPTNELLQRRWIFMGTEEFSVVHAPDSAHRNDFLDLRSDSMFEWVQGGLKSSGVWKLNESNRTITFTDGKSKKSLTYNLKGISATDLTLEYQTPDLVRTRTRYAAAKE